MLVEMRLIVDPGVTDAAAALEQEVAERIGKRGTRCTRRGDGYGDKHAEPDSHVPSSRLIEWRTIQVERGIFMSSGLGLRCSPLRNAFVYRPRDRQPVPFRPLSRLGLGPA